MASICYCLRSLVVLFMHMVVLVVCVESQNASNVTTTEVPEVPVVPETRIEKNTDIGICTCDLTSGGCDVNCCCDDDCSDEDRNAFSRCDDKVPESDSMLCINSKLVFRDNSPYIKNVTNPGLFCLKVDNFKERNYYKMPETIDTVEKFDEYQRRFGESSYQPDDIEDDTKRQLYKSGDHLVTIYEGDIEGILGFPAQLITPECVDSNPAAYLHSEVSRCARYLDASNLDHSLKSAGYYERFKIVVNPEILSARGTNRTNSTEGIPPWSNAATESALEENSTIFHSLYALPIDVEMIHKCVNSSGIARDCEFGTVPEARCHQQISGDYICMNLVTEVEYTFEYVIPGTLYGASVKFVFSDLTLRSNAVFQTFRMTFRKSGTEGNVTSRSGNPGYQVGLPVMAGKLQKNTINKDDIDTDVKAIFLDADPSHWLTIMGASSTGDCLDGNAVRMPVTFGEDLRSSCGFRVTFDSLTNTCDVIHSMTLNLLVGDDPPTHVATFGNSKVENISDWVQIFGRDVTHQEVLSSEGVCRNVPVGMHYEIVYASVGSLGNPQPKILGVLAQYQYEDVHFLCVGEYCQPGNDHLEQTIEIVTSVGFIDASEKAVGVSAEKPRIPVRLPEDFFYPFS